MENKSKPPTAQPPVCIQIYNTECEPSLKFDHMISVYQAAQIIAFIGATSPKKKPLPPGFIPMPK